MTRGQKRLLLGLLAFSSPSAAVRAQEVVAVLSPAPGPYQDAFDGFLKVFGASVAAYHLPQDKPAIGPDTRIVVAFGGEAVLQPYPRRVTVIAGLAPGLSESALRGKRVVFVAMKPPPAELLAQMMKLQPKMKRLAVLWNAKNAGGYLAELRRVAAGQGIEAVPILVSGPGDIPDALRAQSVKADALWLGPDPRLITPETFQTIKQFSWDNAMPFYVPTAGLAAAGAAAAVSIGTREIGRQAAELARQALSGNPLPNVLYPEKSELTVNPASAAKAGLKIAPETLNRADRVLP